jgi:hypothetical protein
VTDQSISLDAYTLQCIECHDTYLDNPGRSFGAGTWQHFAGSRLNHPIGISHVQIAIRKPRKFNPPVVRAIMHIQKRNICWL